MFPYPTLPRSMLELLKDYTAAIGRELAELHVGHGQRTAAAMG